MSGTQAVIVCNMSDRNDGANIEGAISMGSNAQHKAKQWTPDPRKRWALIGQALCVVRLIAFALELDCGLLILDTVHHLARHDHTHCYSTRK